MKSIEDTLKWDFDLLNLSSPKVMGILNLTPDSFFDGGKYTMKDHALTQAGRMIEAGAAIIDIGAISTRPFAEIVSEEDEWERIKNVLPQIKKNFPGTLISIDTFRSKIAHKAINEGADMINDISGGQLDAHLLNVVASQRVPYIMMHMQGNPQNMQDEPRYENVTHQVNDFFAGQLKKLEALGLRKNIMLDPGFGFGKTLEHNYQLLGELKTIKKHRCPILTGLSRKSMIYKVLETTPELALNGTTALNMLALTNGANILRVHDVKEAIETIRLFLMYQKSNTH